MELGYSEGINFFDPNQVHKLEVTTAPDTYKQLLLLGKYYYWTFILMMGQCAILICIVLFLFFHHLSPFKVYMYYLTKAFEDHSDCLTLWKDKKFSK